MEASLVTLLASSNKCFDCEICRSIWSTLTTSAIEEIHVIKLGSFEEALSSKCSRHTPMVEWFKRRCDSSIKSSIMRAPGYHSEIVAIIKPGVLKLDESTLGIAADLLLLRKESVKDHCGCARILDPKWVDTRIVDHWRNRCVSSHGKRCENPTRIWRVRPAWVVDTKDARLVPGSECHSYVALSYRWGNAQGLQVQPDTMEKLQRPKALNDPAISSQLAPMVRHAIFLASIIGERYLWVDTLCIDHSRATESTEQLQLMGAIYANASLTIVILDRDAEEGFPGLKGTSPHRDFDNDVIQFGEEQFVQDKRCSRSPIDRLDGPYHQRGWTYQEYTMSSRRLILANNSLNWECQCGVSTEQLHPAVEFQPGYEREMHEIMRGMPDLQSLSNILCTYNVRVFKYDEDALPGISGLLAIFSRCFSGGFLCGIPEMFFEAALSWQPGPIRTNLRRRTPSHRPDPDRLHPCHLPSWSWIGWEGSVAIGRIEAGRKRAWCPWTIETVPITTWYTCDSPTALHKRRIRSSWFENREAFKDFSKPLPPGWTRHTITEANKGSRPYPDGYGQYMFLHRNMTEEEEETPWHWPFPVPDIHESTQPFMPEQTPYLFCDTRRARVFAFQTGQRNVVTLYSGQDKVIGSLILHNEEQLQRFPRLVTGWAAAKEVELVAICQARNYRTKEGCLKKWEDYTVLWVEWTNGVAYRLACGQVDKAAWEGLTLEDISLILG